MTEWISVEDGLPDDDVDVLAFIAKHGSWASTDRKLGVRTLRRGEINGYSGWADPHEVDCFLDVEGSVTYWMSYPSPPEFSDQAETQAISEDSMVVF